MSGRPPEADATAPILEVHDLAVQFRSRSDDAWNTAVDGLSFQLKRGRTLGIVGESGSGKSVTNLAVMRLLPGPATCRVQGRIHFGGHDLMALPEAALRAIRGDRVAMIFQDPMTSLNPYLTIGAQLIEVLTLHRRVARKAAREAAIAMLERVGIPSPARRFDQYPHELSGGMRQRVMIAMMLLNRPEILIADEPTTALDVTIQAQILDLLRDLQREIGMAIILITHDLGVIAESADDVIVMYAGRVMEQAPVGRLFAAPSHAYTLGLLFSMPRADRPHMRLEPIPGRPPDPGPRAPGCPFAPRCAFRTERCERELPQPVEVGPGHFSACFHHERVRAHALASDLVSTNPESTDG
jgi:oligopeptide/dipeptide ABC transporter ATP-binding protein